MNSSRRQKQNPGDDFWNRRPVVLTGIPVLLALIGSLDYASGFNYSLSVFYLLPIIWAGWHMGMLAGSAVAVASVLIIKAVDWLGGAKFGPGLAPLWNTLIQLALYLTVIWLLERWKALNSALETRVKERTQELDTEIAHRVQLEREILEITERERRRIGYDLHDILCQHLAATALAAKVLEEKLTSSAEDRSAEAAHIVSLTESGLTIARDISRGLSPIPVGEGNLRYALEDLASSTRDIFKVVCQLESDGPDLSLDFDRAIHLYRIAQEAVSNAIRHGGARHIILNISSLGNRGILTIQDDGKGMPETEDIPTSRMGLRIMRQRAEMLGGNLDILKEADRGITISCSFPMKGDSLFEK